MADTDNTGLAPTDAGQAPADSTGTPATAPTQAAEQAPQSTDAPAEDTFFDPSRITDPNLQAAYKEMQGSYTKKMQALASQRKELEEVSALRTAFQKDPHSLLNNLATQYGYKLTPAQAQAQAKAAAEAGQPEEWAPNSWGEVLTRAEQQAREKIMAELAPVIDTIKGQKAQAIESELDALDPTWRDYEDRMIELVGKHPTLATDYRTLYEMAVPAEKREARATARALEKLQKISSAGKPQGASQSRHTNPAPANVASFEDAVNAARLKLAAGA